MTVDRDTFTPTDLKAAVDEVYNNPKYRENAKKISSAIRDVKRTATQESIDWVEYAINHDGALFNVLPVHGKSFIELSGADAYAFLIALLSGIFIGIPLLIKRACCGGKAKKAKTQ